MREGRATILALSLAPALALSLMGAAPTRKAEPSIGVATQEANGTIVLTLRAEGPGGMVGDGQLRYPPDHKDYAMIARHVGPIPRGGSVFVKPFGER